MGRFHLAHAPPSTSETFDPALILCPRPALLHRLLLEGPSARTKQQSGAASFPLPLSACSRIPPGLTGSSWLCGDVLRLRRPPWIYRQRRYPDRCTTCSSEGLGHQITPNNAPRSAEDCEVSPGSRPVSSQHSLASNSKSDIAPWEQQNGEAFNTNNHHVFDAPSRSVQHNGVSRPASTWTALWAPTTPEPNERSLTPGDNDAGTAAPQQDFSEYGYTGEDRRPSLASARTLSSNGSSASRTRAGGQRKIQDFFGEDIQTIESRHTSQTSLPTVSLPGLEDSVASASNRQQSSAANASSYNSRQVSPDGSRPRTPQPSSEVTPWLFQDHQDISTFGDAPIRQDLIEKGKPTERRPSVNNPRPTPTSSHTSKLHLGRHRQQKSSDEVKQKESDASRKSTPKDTRPPTRHTTFPMASKQQESKSVGPPTSPSAAFTREANIARVSTTNEATQNGGTNKRSLLDRIRHRKKGDKAVPEPQASSPAGSTMSLLNPDQTDRDLTGKLPPRPTVVTTQYNTDQIFDTPLSTTTTRQSQAPPSAKKEHRPHLPFKTKRGMSTAAETPMIKDPNDVRNGSIPDEALWTLDTDLSHMEGIVSGKTPAVMTPPVAPSASSWLGDAPVKEDQPPIGGPGGVWDAPDSWAVKRFGEESTRLHEHEERASFGPENDSGTAYCIRIFRSDDTFATLSLPISATAAEIAQLLGRKNFTFEDISNFHLILRKNETSRQLSPLERPLAIQKKLLEQAGYNDTDHLEDLGGQDHSYLCRFSFLPVQMSGYSRFEKDPNLNRMQKFSNVDLRGRNLVNIPVALYIKSSEIVFLNLSKNLSLDVPKDFIQGCTNLREIKYTSNEAWSLPPSFSLASKLTVLDISNNRLELLDPAQLNKLANLASLKLANNKLTSLPEHFSGFKALRNLNISSNFLNELPSAICEIPTLGELDVSFNSIVALPEIGRLKNLERFWITNNKLSGKLEESVIELKNLKELDIRFNALENIDVLSRLPQLEHLVAGHNSVTSFHGSFVKIRTLYLDHNPVTRFDLDEPALNLTTLSLASAKLTQLPDDLYAKIANLTKLFLDKNHFVTLPPHFGKLTRLEHLRVAKNSLNTLPAEIGLLSELAFLDARENNINKLPQELWWCRKLETLNLSSNVLDTWPKPPTQLPVSSDGFNQITPLATPSVIPQSPILEDPELFPDSAQGRRPSHVSASNVSTTSSQATVSTRKNSVASVYGQSPRKPSNMLNRTVTEATLSGSSRKESIAINRQAMMFVGSLRYLYLADNRLNEEVFDQLAILQELRMVNLSYNLLYDIPPRSLRRWSNLTELYLSGNDLTSLPAEDLEELSSLRTLHINGNKFQVLPAELGKVQKLAVLDAGNNNLKYNVSNWPYDWNWNRNLNLKYLNLSGNKRLEIKPPSTYLTGRDNYNLTDFNALGQLRVLGLMDVTLMITSVPDTTDDRRVRTSGSTVGSLAYGIADCLGRHEHLSTMDIVVERFDGGASDETLFGLFDGVPQASGGSKIAKYLQENFELHFRTELKRRQSLETPEDALRRTYLALNKDLATLATEPHDAKERRAVMAYHRGSVATQTLHQDDLASGCVATVMYLQGTDLYVSNVGDAQAVLIQSEGGHRFITRKHDPAEAGERQRIREAGGYVSRQGRLNDALEVSRAFGFTSLMPAVVAAPSVQKIAISESDEMIVLASRELWDYVTPDCAVDLARSETDMMRAAQKLRDFAIAYGAGSKITVMAIGVSDLRRNQRARYRTHSMSMGPSGLPDEFMVARRGKRGRDATLDSKLARLPQELEAPIGMLSLVFTDIKSSTALWESHPMPMRSAIKSHNEVMRRHLRLIGGYEVKTEGDAFMVAFSTVTSALLWTFTIQSQLLEVQWPQEILNSTIGQEVSDEEGTVLFRGLSVRMGIHYGAPVCEPDPVTKRMDYFGPMVNRAARISAVADGGQITVSAEFIAEIQRLLETMNETDRSNSVGSEDQFNDEMQNTTIQRELRSLSSHGFEVKDLGHRRLKGLENPEHIYLMYPPSLSGRLVIQQQRADAEKAIAEGVGIKTRDSQLTIELNNVWDLWSVSLRLEMLCSALESAETAELRAPEMALLERTRERGGEITDHFLVNFVEHQVSRIETCITALALRNMVKPFSQGMFEQACPMSSILDDVAGQLAELKAWKEQVDFDMAES